MKKLKIMVAISALSLAGCGTPAYITRVGENINSGNCDAALREINNAHESSPGLKATLIGAVYHDCKHDNATSIRYTTLGARYGYPPAIQNLVSVGAPVPKADLANLDNERGYVVLKSLNAAVQGWNTGTNSSFNCTSTNLYGIVNTNCR